VQARNDFSLSQRDWSVRDTCVSTISFLIPYCSWVDSYLWPIGVPQVATASASSAPFPHVCATLCLTDVLLIWECES
jgi:hypothetical protein